MSLPLIGVTADVKEVDPYFWHAAPANYLDAAADIAGVMPMIIPDLAERLDIDALLDRIDGLLVTGSRSNVHPSQYNVDPQDKHEPYDELRDATSLPLIRRALERGVPMLAICRGIQELNVALGGSITADFQIVRGLEKHSYPWEGTQDERFALAHEIKVENGSHLSQILKNELASGPVSVNSLHTQALDQLGKNIIVEAIAHDGTVEAVRVEGAPGFAIGVQWHPEYWAHSDPASKAIFKAFGDATRTYLHTKSNT